MRTYTLPLTLFCILHVGVFAQRPWIKCAWPDVVESPSLAIVSNTLIAYSGTSASSYDHGATWSAQNDIVGPIKGIVDFPALSGSIALTQLGEGAPVHGYFTQNGSNWSHFDSLDIGQNKVTGVATIKIRYFIATNTNTIYVRGTTTTEVTVTAAGQPGVTDIAAIPEALAVLTASGMHISTDEGQSWNEVHPDGGVPPSTMPKELSVINGAIYASSDYGVLRLQVSNATLLPVSQWPVEIGVPDVAAMSGDAQHLVALVTVNNQRQMFRLSISDTAWSYSAYPLPGVQPVLDGYNKLVVDNGWAITNHQLQSGPADSTGIFRFDLNDFTDVIEHKNAGNIRIRSTENGLTIVNPPANPYHVRVYDITMRLLWEGSVEGGVGTVALAPSINGLLCVVVADNGSQMLFGTVLR